MLKNMVNNMRKIILFILSLMLISGCNENNSGILAEAQPIKSIQLTPQNVNLPIGFEQPFTVTAQFYSGEVVDISSHNSTSWSVSDTSIATINEQGVLIGHSSGEVDVKATVRVNGEDLVQVSTISVVGAMVENIQITPVSSQLPVGLTKQYKVVAIFSDNSTLDVTDWEGISWFVNDPEIAEINESGEVSTLATGDVTILATAEVNGIEFVSSAFLTITTAVPQTMKVTPINDSVHVGLTKAFKAHVTYSDNSVIDVTQEAALSWSTSSSVATIDNTTGIAKGERVGTAIISASGQFDGIQFDESVSLTVSDAVPQTLQVTPVNDSVPVGLTKAFKAYLTYSDNSVADVTQEAALSWSSSSPNVVTIDHTTGVATGEQVGTAIITASGQFNGVQFNESASVTVSDAILVDMYFLEESYTISPSQKGLLIEVKGRFSDGSINTLNNNSDISFQSTSPNIVSVNQQGEVDALQVGEATIIASYYEPATDTLHSIDTPITVINLYVEVEHYYTHIPHSTSLRVYLDGMDVTNDAVLASSDSNIASVSNDGVLTGNKNGEITVSAMYNGYTYITSPIYFSDNFMLTPGVQARQSSIYRNNSSLYGVHFSINNSRQSTSSSIAHTSFFDEPAWFDYTFPEPITIKGLNLWNRNDCCWDRLANVSIEVYDINEDLITSYQGSSTVDNLLTFKIAGINGVHRIKVIANNGNNKPLHYAEIEIY
ncbi:Ig-like domain-containing protein [Vibrio aestuarianus]|uniref:Ig-like domain-containing protein n=1 Tax=Vibrio aestuarianus TaxID=28171 RepID=UPI00237CC5AD|nr:Ig-like domain-containing protein [Vibrio aestuarianus]MDE1352027.1 Ig-like domain-containing protein [Vibrio aestuarianus]